MRDGPPDVTHIGQEWSPRMPQLSAEAQQLNAVESTSALPVGWMRACSIDVETNPADGDRIFKLGAIRTDTDATIELSTSRQDPGDATRRLNVLTDGAEVIVGHNLRRHDLPQLERQFLGLTCLRLPLIDTLELSAIAFPQNPYHRLVKGYKLVSDARNEPLRDARLTLDLLHEEIQAFAALHKVDPAWAGLLHHLLRDEPALDRIFARIRGASAPDNEAAAQALRAGFTELCCSTRLDRLVARDLTGDPALRWPIAYALSWLRVAGGNSVLPAWVYAAVPMVRTLIHELREFDCGDPGCRYCVQQHNPEGLLLQFFSKPGFRSKPEAPNGTSLQRQIVAAGLARKSILAVLPTGGGKSICYQLPALAHYWRSGRLTVIVSPLQSLMKDQVDNLIASGVQCAVTINGLLTPLERRAALDKIRLGDAGIVLVSPEQFRNRSFVEAIRLRQIATWVFDEAHCLSKWGHDFRTDYLYVARFIREHFVEQQAPVACFTATAKPDVIDDLVEHFQVSLGIELQRFLGGHARTNLDYVVVPVTKAEKAQRIVEMLAHDLADGGGAVVFCASRKATADYAELIAKSGLRCAHFHAGLDPNQKKEVQRAFIGGELQVIAATNAFGMGVDKPDIRVVVHADIPGSLENYLQEAGRAGRDGGPARCVLLFDEADVETQFRLSAGSQLTLRDFSGLLKGIRRRVDRFRSPEIVVSAKELLLDSDNTDIEIDRPDANTKVTTAVAWLERSGFLLRNENRSRVFPASLRVRTLQEAIDRIRAANLKDAARVQYEAVASALFGNVGAEGVSTDELMLDAGIQPEDCFRILHALETLGILANDLGLKAAVSKGVTGASDLELTRLDRLERELLSLMSEQAPDADSDSRPQLLGIRAVCSELRRRLELPEGDTTTHPDRVRKCLRSLAESFGSGTDKRSMLQVRSVGADSLRVILYRPWSQIREICTKRRAVSQVVLAALLDKIPAGTRQANFIIECKAKELLDAIESDIELASTVTDPSLALEHALLYMHENGILQLDKGRAVFRAAMTIQVRPEASKRRFLKEDYAPLQEHYRERTLQTHVMHEYAKLGARKMGAALALTAAYFRWPRRRFIKEYFKGRPELLDLATTDESFRRIVDALQHPVQQALVCTPDQGNHLVLAGPGSGKTRVIVHRIAYLLRVRRIAAEHIIALAFNRSAAMELRRRLAALVGDDARGVTVLTYHAMALRLTGTSLEGIDRHGAAIDFDKLIQDAIDLLEGRTDAFADADEARDRLLQGYEYIFVDEYQDIDERQYGLISALAGRRLTDADGRLSIMAVGDDDQNIYAFKGASVEFIRRFQADYQGQVTYLVENFRSTQHIIEAANHVIQRAADRMKVDHPIRIDTHRLGQRPGGRWAGIDPEGHGAVRLIAAPVNANLQAQLVHAEIERIRRLDPETRLGDIAVLARSHGTLQPLRALCEVESIRCALADRGGAGGLPLLQSREGRHVIDALRSRRRGLVSLAALLRWLRLRRNRQPANPFWGDLLAAALELQEASPATRMVPDEVVDWYYEFAAEARRDGSPDALRLLTAHSAKGLEFKHVIVMDCGDWNSGGDDERRLLYVAMTRAKDTLTLFNPEDGRSRFLVDLSGLDGVRSLLPENRPRTRADLQRSYFALGPGEVDLGFAGRVESSGALHRLIARQEVGMPVQVRDRSILTPEGQLIGRVASKFTLTQGRILPGQVSGIMVRSLAHTPAQYLPSIRTERWEVVLVDLVDTGPAIE